jgi:hypothetical protein
VGTKRSARSSSTNPIQSTKAWGRLAPFCFAAQSLRESTEKLTVFASCYDQYTGTDEVNIMKLRLISLFSIASIVILFIAMSARQRTDAQQPPIPLPLPESTAEPIPVDREKYSPARYGIPATLAGFEVLAVVTHEHNPCSIENYMEVHLQESDETWDKDRPNQTSASITAALTELTALYPNAVISTSGRIDDLDTFFMQLEQASRMSQESVATGRCIPSGVIIALTPTVEVDREKYSPARYGVPEILAGFEVVAVVTHEHNPCSPEDFMEVYLRVPQATASEYLQSDTAAQIDEAMAELNQLYPKAGISTFGPYVHPDVFFAQLDKTMRQAQEVVALGRCYPLGGPSIVVTPSETE